jgi:signal transduction histidine kinase/ActR/RegA family two-component response regulator
MPDRTRSIAEIRSDVCNITLVWLAAFATLAVAASLARYFQSGWLPIMGVHILIYGVLLAVTALRRNFSYKFRAITVVFLYFATGVGGHLSFGTPYSLGHFIAASLMAAVFFGEVIGIVAVAVSTLTVGLIYFVFKSGLLVPPDPPASVMELTTWLTNAAAIGIVSIGPLIALSRLRRFLEAEQRIAERANSVKSEFLALMTHEIRTPLTAILGISDLLLTGKLAGDQRDGLSHISSAGKHLLELINDILDFSKLEAKRGEVEHIAFNLRDLIKHIHEMMAPLAAKKSLELKLDMHADLACSVVSDPTSIKRVLYNLIGNAIKFTERGSVVVRAELRLKDRQSADLYIQIVDTGIGMSSEQQAKLFQPFTQADTGITRRFGGTGLGLSVSQKLVELLGGQIVVSSKVGHGSAFEFSIPVAIGENLEPITNNGQSAPSFGESRKLRVLVAEDTEASRFLLEALLKRWGHSVDSVQNGALALNAVRGGDYDVVIMDMQMPEMDGLTATSEIRKLDSPKKDIPIIALTADVMEDHRSKYLRAGLTEFLGKQVHWPDLSAALQRVVSRQNQ